MVQYKLGPWTLAKPNGKMRSSPKNILLPENTIKIFDNMVLIQQLPTSLEIFVNISDFIL